MTHLAVDRKVSASTQNQALQALLFLYREVLGVELPWLDNITRAAASRRLPVVLSQQRGPVTPGAPARHSLVDWKFPVRVPGLRLMEALRLRVKDLVLERQRGEPGDRRAVRTLSSEGT